ncbi:inactive pancreatic lipase-related protein 1-like [Centruroides vittatus]|uniref:inactive pancreatic lipase-related protein 1-like n=1 Tax=Centruroides vittatus TaxID=120091 RepID=UPI00350F6AFF
MIVTIFILYVFLSIINKETNADIPCPPFFEYIVFAKAKITPVPPTYFLLYTRKNPSYPNYLTDKNSFYTSHFNPELKTIIIVHGFAENPISEDVNFLKTAFLHYEECNVILVDWKIGALSPTFPKAMRVTLVEGKYIAEQLERWKKFINLDFNKFHIIGFSLSGQLVGFIGKYMKTGRIGRITGIDVIGACFSSFSPRYKLHYSDAKFVDAISTTSANQFITGKPTGHLHFMIDGGLVGRGCKDNIANFDLNTSFIKGIFVGLYSAILRSFFCSHMRGFYLFASTLYHPEFLPVAYKCKDYETFKKGKCSECGTDGRNCAAIGIHAEKYADKIINGTVTMYAATTFTDGYFLYQYHVEVTFGFTADTTIEVGKLVLIINSKIIKILDKDLYIQYVKSIFKPGATYTYLMTTTHDLEPITNLKVFWYSALPRKDNKLYIRCVKIVPMNNLQTDRFKLTTFGTTNGEAILPHHIVKLHLGKSCGFY